MAKLSTHSSTEQREDSSVNLSGVEEKRQWSDPVFIPLYLTQSENNMKPRKRLVAVRDTRSYAQIMADTAKRYHERERQRQRMLIAAGAPADDQFN